MSQELKTVTVNLKSLDQDIKDPIVAGGADANGRTFRIIFDQEAAAQITPETKVYLSWFHRQKKIKGYNVFTQTNDDPIIWEIKWPQALLFEGDVLCCIELVDSVSIAQSTNFIVHVLSDPNDGSSFVVSDDFTLFQNAVIRLNCIGDQMKKQMVAQKIEFEDMLLEFSKVKVDAKEAVDTANAAASKADDAAKKATEAMEQVEQIGNKADAALEEAKKSLAIVDARIDSKLDTDKCGITFTEDIPTIKEYIDRNIQIPHLEMIDFDKLVGEGN